MDVDKVYFGDRTDEKSLIKLENAEPEDYRPLNNKFIFAP